MVRNENEFEDLPPIPPPKDDEEVKLEPEETIAKRIKLNPREREKQEPDKQTPNKLLTRLLILLEQIKAGKRKQFIQIKKKSGKYCIFYISIMTSLKKFTTISSNHYNHERKYCDKRPQNFLF